MLKIKSFNLALGVMLIATSFFIFTQTINIAYAEDSIVTALEVEEADEEIKVSNELNQIEEAEEIEAVERADEIEEVEEVEEYEEMEESEGIEETQEIEETEEFEEVQEYEEIEEVEEIENTAEIIQVEIQRYLVLIDCFDFEGKLIGSYEIDKDIPGDYIIEPIDIDGYITISPAIKIQLNDEEPIYTVEFSYEKVIVQKQLIKYRERIYNINTNEGIEGVKVMAASYESEEQYISFTDNEGYFELMLEPGMYKLTLLRKGYKDKVVDVEI